MAFLLLLLLLHLCRLGLVLCSLSAFRPRSLRILLGLSAISSGILVLERSIAPRSNLGDVSARWLMRM
ncbi:unnamed protein product, partial [Musa hybrid cultivar]